MMYGIAQRWTSAGLAATVLLLIGVGGCGLARPAVGPGQPAGPTATGLTVTVMMTVTVRPTPRAVTLHLGQMHARVTEAVSVTVTVTVANGLPRAILVEDHQSECRW
jgi:hypothetical protein